MSKPVLTPAPERDQVPVSLERAIYAALQECQRRQLPVEQWTAVITAHCRNFLAHKITLLMWSEIAAVRIAGEALWADVLGKDEKEKS